MASLRRVKGSWQIRGVFQGKRIAVSVSGIELGKAEEWKLFVQAIIDSIETKRPLDRITQEWIASLSDLHRLKLIDKGLIQPDSKPAKEDKLLSEYLNEYFESRKSDVKPATWIFYQHT